MDISLFEVMGPIMIGPSSSHTAGTARLARTAALIAGSNFYRVSFGLHGSLSKTGIGHGTDKALLAGVLGIREDDEALRDAFIIAKSRGVKVDFYDLEMENCHENSVRITFYYRGGKTREIEGSSIGGGRICITRVDGAVSEISGEAPTLLIVQKDIPGMVNEISRVLTDAKLNIGVMRVTRQAKGQNATTTIEVDSSIPESVVRQLKAIPGILTACAIELSE